MTSIIQLSKSALIIAVVSVWYGALLIARAALLRKKKVDIYL